MYMEILEEQVKLVVVYKLIGGASAWWDNLCNKVVPTRGRPLYARGKE